jgi:hypothetical protein
LEPNALAEENRRSRAVFTVSVRFRYSQVAPKAANDVTKLRRFMAIGKMVGRFVRIQAAAI